MKALFILLLAGAIFGGAYYATWLLYLKPQAEIREEQQAPPAPPPPDPALPEFERIRALQDNADIISERAAWQDFIERYPRSTKINDAKERLGQINISLYLSPVQTPEKTLYIVKPGDVINKVAGRLKSTPELVMRSNNLQGSMLRIGQKLIVPPAGFTLVINRAEKKLTLLQQDKFFRQYQLLTAPTTTPAAVQKKSGGKPQKINGRVSEKIAWNGGTRVVFTDKTYNEAEHWILISPGGHNLYTEGATLPGSTAPHKPPGGGYSLAPESLRELAALVRKSDPVIIE